MEFRGASLNEYDKLVIRMSTPRVVIDNVVCATATLVKVDSAREHGILLDAVQALTDMNLCIKKAYISSDGRWFMDDESALSCIQMTLARSSVVNPESLVPSSETALELMGTDRSGLLSEVFAVLAELSCRVVNATVWTHRGRIASLIHVKEEESGNLIEDAHKISRIEDRLRNVLKGDSHGMCSAKTVVTLDVTLVERRLHQMMYTDRDYEWMFTPPTPISVTIQNCLDTRL